MMMLVAGKIKIFKDGIGMRQQIIRLLKPYDFFSYRGVAAGERPVLDDLLRHNGDLPSAPGAHTRLDIHA